MNRMRPVRVLLRTAVMTWFSLVYGFVYAAADSTERRSPIDANPACMERDKNSAGPECTLQDGKPHRPIVKRKPPDKPSPPPPTPPPTTRPPPELAK